MLIESSKYQESSPPLTSAGKKFVKLSHQNIIRYSDFFVDQATPGFELGKKDLQSPALPLGHVAKTIQKIYENIPFFWGGLLIFVLVSWILFSLIPFLKKILTFLFGLDTFLRLIVSYLKTNTLFKNTPSPFYIEKPIVDFQSQNKNSGQIWTINYWLWIWIHERFPGLNIKLCFPNDIKKSKWIHH